MPAPLAKGTGHRSSSPHHRPSPYTTTARGPNAPLTTGLIIAASVIVAAGIAIYESPQVRQWVDQSRRKIAVALHSLGDEIQPRRPSESSQDFEERKKRRDDLIRRNRNDLIRRARQEGVAVDLDELARIGREDFEMAERRGRSRTNASQTSFDDLVGNDGMLRKDAETAKTATATEAADKNLRRRGAVGLAAGVAAGAAMSNPFDDDHAQILFDRDDDEAPSPTPFSYVESRDNSATVEGEPASPRPLIDLTPDSVHLHAEDPQTASIPQSEADDPEPAAQSFYSFTSSNPMQPTYPTVLPTHEEDSDVENGSAGTLTPRSERSAFTGASVVDSHADDIAVLSTQSDDDHDARSEIFSESGFTEAGFSEAGFSELGEQRAGVMTPNSWTDVGSEDESEWGGAAQHGHVSQIHQ